MLFFAPSSEKNAGGEKKEGTKEELSLPVSRESVTTSQSVSQSFGEFAYETSFYRPNSNAHFRMIDPELVPILRD